MSARHMNVSCLWPRCRTSVTVFEYLANPITDAPRYRHGLMIAAACVIAAAVLIWTWKVLYWAVDRRQVNREKAEQQLQIV